ncbi:UNVERIFIED_CONTAM: AP3-complex subunit beta-A [Sesamum angustifolium]|uniref:AP3-complex subunit beta-A n=1 Tax=Sesamum angustifolium TaxID=2727405 RepID=A0AAW2P148_9LAMI
MSELQIIIGYVLELAKSDLNYDIRDRARFLKNFLSYCMRSYDAEEVKEQTEYKDLTHILAEYIFGGQRKVQSEPFSYRFYLPGSLSQIVLHAAPGYEPLPEPCCLIDESHSPSHVQGTKMMDIGATDSEPNEIHDSDAMSGSLEEENTSDYSSQASVSGSSGVGGSYYSASDTDGDEEAGALINLSDGAPALRNHIKDSEENSASGFTDFGELMSNRALESWLNENPGSSQNSYDVGHAQKSLARISIKDIAQLVKPKSYTLLDPANGKGLSVDYRFSSEVSSISPQFVCLQVSFRNYSTEPMSIYLFLKRKLTRVQILWANQCHQMKATLVSMEEISSLAPGQTTSRILHVRFEHHLLPLKLVLWCNGRKLPVKLRPDIGYFIKPLPMDIGAFSKKESQLPGMFEYIRRCTFADHISQPNEKDEQHSQIKDIILMICEKLALKMLNNANLFLVSVDMPVAASLNDLSGLCLRLSGEILSNSIPCLVTLTLKGTCSEPLEVSVKMNCEETVFGLNLLNRIVNFLAEPAP